MNSILHIYVMNEMFQLSMEYTSEVLHAGSKIYLNNSKFTVNLFDPEIMARLYNVNAWRNYIVAGSSINYYTFFQHSFDAVVTLGNLHP